MTYFAAATAWLIGAWLAADIAITIVRRAVRSRR